MSPSQHPLLGRRPAHTGPKVAFLPQKPDLALVCGRLHECCGPARRTLAMWIAAQMTGPVIWIAPSWCRDRLHPEGMTTWVDPGRFLFVDAMRAEDVLWSLEESLRSGAVPLVVGDLPGPPGLTQVRRMHLAAETGGKEGNHTPLGILLTPDQGGAQGVESRWHLAPDHGQATAHGAEITPGFVPGQWQLSRLRARTAPQARWAVRRPAPAGSLDIKAA